MGEGTMGKAKGKSLGMDTESNKAETVCKMRGSSEGLQVFLVVGGCPGSLCPGHFLWRASFHCFLFPLGRGVRMDTGGVERRKVRLKSSMHAFAFNEVVGLLASPCSSSCGCMGSCD